VKAEWSDIEDDHVRISTTWRVFEISSGDVGDAGNYGEQLRCSLPVQTTTHQESLRRFAPLAARLRSPSTCRDLHPLPIFLLHRLHPRQGVGLRQGIMGLCESRLFVTLTDSLQGKSTRASMPLGVTHSYLLPQSRPPLMAPRSTIHPGPSLSR